MSKNDCVSREDALRYAESIRQYLNELYNDGWLGISDADWRALMEIILRVGDIPSADVKPVVRGKWEEIEIHYCGRYTIVSMRCSECKRYHNEVYIYGNPVENVHFCPNCGADMRARANEK